MVFRLIDNHFDNHDSPSDYLLCDGPPLPQRKPILDWRYRRGLRNLGQVCSFNSGRLPN